MDTDLNGTPDLLEDIVLASPAPFAGVPFTVTGVISPFLDYPGAPVHFVP